MKVEKKKKKPLQYFSVDRQCVLALSPFLCGFELRNMLGCDIPIPYSTYNSVFRLPEAESLDEVINVTIHTTDTVIVMGQLNELSNFGTSEAMERKVGGLCKGTSKILFFFFWSLYFILAF